MGVDLYKIYSMLVVFVAFSASGECLAAQKQGDVANSAKMPVLINKNYVVVGKNEAEKLLGQSGIKENTVRSMISDSSADKIVMGVAEISNADYKEINMRVSEIKSNLCLSNSGVTYEVWLQQAKETSGGLSWVVSLIHSDSSESGIKAIINCAHKENKRNKKHIKTKF